MPIFKRNTIFHAEEALPDPDDLKLRFRRRVLFLALVGFLVILGFPVFRELAVPLHLRDETRAFAERLLETRLLASANRAPVSLELGSNSMVWHRAVFAKNSTCGTEAVGPSEQWVSNNLTWNFKLQKENGETISGRSLCLHPQKGLLLDSFPIGDGKLLVTVKASQDDTQTAHLLVSSHGADIQTLID